MNPFAGWEPAPLYSFLHDVFSIPRVSGHEEQIAQYLVVFAEKRGLWYHRDVLNNVLIRLPATPGYEHIPPVLLEGHTDMVAAKTPDSNHDFMNDPVELVVEGNICRANKTTLGADNGCGVAIMLAILDKPDLLHPEIECIFTAQEEIGLVGIKAFDLSLLKSRRVIGLDAGSEGVFRKGVSTKYNHEFELPIQRESIVGPVYTLTVDGLIGGHHSVVIPQDRANAIQLMGRMLYSLLDSQDVRLIDIGRKKHQKENSSAEACRAQLVLASGSENAFREAIESESNRISKEYQETDSGIRIRLQKEPETQVRAIDKTATNAIAQCGYLVPYGATRWVVERPDEPKCYSLINNIQTLDNKVIVDLLISTEMRCYGTALNDKITALCQLIGMRSVANSIEFGWDPEPDSTLRETMRKTYVKLFGKEPVINISHGSNDCVHIKEQIPDFDVVTTAATYLDYHTPNERLFLDSVGKVYQLVSNTLKALCVDFVE